MFLVPMVDVVTNIFAQPYPDLGEKQAYIKKVIQLEEERFQTTLVQGLELLNRHIQGLEETGVTMLDGATAFKLYDTFGFPWELTLEIIEEHGMKLDKQAFDVAMKEQRERARAGRQASEGQVVLPDLSHLKTEELCIDEQVSSGSIMLFWKAGIIVDEVHDGEDVGVILDVTPFHPEGGGQVGDIGWIEGPLGKIEITAAKRLLNGTVYHVGHVTEGSLKVRDVALLKVDIPRRRAIARNHTATHLLQAGLKKVLGSHVNQAGSFVNAERLRFDFSHFSGVTVEELAAVEKFVQHSIFENIEVGITEKTQDEAKKMGAIALFGEKYGETVRVVAVGDVSTELCGGSHVESTAEISLFKIVSEVGIGSGIRRIEAVTGPGAIEYINIRETFLQTVATMLKARPEEVVARVESALSRVKELENELALLNTKQAQIEVQELLAKSQYINDIQVVVGQVSSADMDGLRMVADMIRDHLKCGVVTLGAVHAEKVNFVAMATTDAVSKGIHAGNIVKQVAKVAGGGGGGRADMAQAGGKLPEKIMEALQSAIEVITQQIK